MLSDDELRDAMRGLASRVSTDPATLLTVQRNCRRIKRRRHGYAATGVAAVLVAGPFAVNAATSGSDGGPQVVTPQHRASPGTHLCVTPTPVPGTPGGLTTPTPTPSGDRSVTPIPSSHPPRCAGPTPTPSPNR